MRHARKMLEEMKLRDLGQFAAHMGFQLVPFFKKEQGRAAKTEEPVKALQAIHRDFEWPYERPTSNSMSKRLLKDLSRSLSLPDSSNATNYQDPIDMLNRKFESQHINQYSSLMQQQRSIQFEELSIASLQDVHVLPMHATGDSRSLAGLSEFSEQCDSIEMESLVDGNQLQEQISNLVVDGARGPVRMEMQLRYLLELTLEASCYEWSLLVALVLRDAETIQRLITRSHDHALETMAAVLKAIEKWAALESPGYRVFLLCIRQQNQNILSRFMQLDSLPDLYQPPSHDARETNRGNLSKGPQSPTLPRNSTATLPSALRKNSDPFAESRSKMSRGHATPVTASAEELGGYTDNCSIQ